MDVFDEMPNLFSNVASVFKSWTVNAANKSFKLNDKKYYFYLILFFAEQNITSDCSYDLCLLCHQ